MKIYLDSNSTIFLVENHPTFAARIVAAMTKWQPSEIVSTAPSRSECLVKPRRSADTAVIALFENHFSTNTTIVPIDWSAFDLGIDLRAKYSRLNTPDALHLAAAIVAGCDVFSTNDQRLRVVTEIRVEVI